MCRRASVVNSHERNRVSKCIEGFSLVELSVVVALLGVLLGLGISFFDKQEKRDDLVFTQERLQEIEEAIRRFHRLENRLPCPADPEALENTASFGVEDNCIAASPSASAIVQINDGGNDETWAGVLPVRTLGLPDRYMLDAWRSRLTYVVPRRFAQGGSPLETLSAQNVSTMIRIQERTETHVINPIDDVNNPVVYIVMSHGPDRRGAYNRNGTFGSCSTSAPEIDAENCDFLSPSHVDNIFVDTMITNSKIDAQYFYDLLLWKTKVTLGAVTVN